MVTDLPDEIVTDLLRSAWIVEAARALVMNAWSEAGPRFDESAEWARARAAIVGRALEGRARTDDDLVEPHARWMRSCAGEAGEPFADLFLARLGGWVDSHVARFLDAKADDLIALGERERARLVWPERMPPAPPFEPLPPLADTRRADVRLRVGILGDLHAGSPRAEALGRAAIADLNAARCDVVVQLGDLTDRGEEPEFELAAALVGELEATTAVTIGNHDAYSAGEHALTGRDRFARWFGRDPDGLLLERAGVRIVVLDSVDYAISPFPPYDLVTGAFGEGRGGALVRGALSQGQHDLLAEVAAPGAAPALVFLHHPPQPFTGFPPVIFGLRDGDSGRLHATADSGNVLAVFAGHTHRNHRGRGFDAVPVMEVGSPRDFPFGYGIVDVAEGACSYRFHQISDERLVAEQARGVQAIVRRYALGSEADRAFDVSAG